MARGNIFANLENKFQYATESQIIDMALDALGRAVVAAGTDNDAHIAGIIILGARVGFDENGSLNEKEKKLVREVIGKAMDADLETNVFPMVSQKLKKEDFDTLELINQLGPAVALPTLEYILACAYVDGKINDSTAEKLEGIFGLSLLAGFFASGLESVPAPIRKVELTSLEKRIYEAFKGDDSLSTVDEVCGKMRGEPEYQVKNALDSLCGKDILYKAETAVGDMYGLIDSDANLNIVTKGTSHGISSSGTSSKNRFPAKSAQVLGAEIRDSVMTVLNSEAKWMTISEIIDSGYDLRGRSPQSIVVQLSRLINDHRVEKKKKKRVRYYASIDAISKIERKARLKEKESDYLTRIRKMKDDMSNAEKEVNTLQIVVNTSQADIDRRNPGKINIIGHFIKERKQTELEKMETELSSKKQHLEKLRKELAALEKELQKVQKDMK